MPFRRASTAAVVCPVFVNGTYVARELARKGAYVVAADPEHDAIGFQSRYVKERIVLPKPAGTGAALVESLLSRRDLYGGVVVPTDDFYVRELHAHYDALSPHYRLAVSPGRSTATALEKSLTYEAAREIGIAVPETIELGHAGDLREAAARIGFPAILRASFSLAFVREFGRKNFPVRGEEELKERFETARRSGHKMMLQEIVPGPAPLIGCCRGYANDAGEIAAAMTSVKLLQYPPHFGIGQIHQSRNIPQIEGYVRKLLKRIGYRGSIFGVEFKYDTRRGIWKLIEINCRSLMSTGLGRLAGIDIVEALWRDKLALPPLPPKRPAEGRKYAYIKDGLLRHKGYPEERKTFREYVRLYRPPIGFSLLDVRDLRPFLHDIAPLFKRRLRKKAHRQR